MSRPATAAVRLLSGEREPCRVATTANIALQGLQTIDGVSIEVNERVLVKGQTDARQNGIYTASEGIWYRASDARDPRAITEGVTVHIQDGTTHSKSVWRFANRLPRVGTDAIIIEFYPELGATATLERYPSLAAAQDAARLLGSYTVEAYTAGLTAFSPVPPTDILLKYEGPGARTALFGVSGNDIEARSFIHAHARYNDTAGSAVTRFVTHSIHTVADGGDVNGPQKTTISQAVSVHKKGFGLGTAVGGEVDAIYIVLGQDSPRNGVTTDGCGILIDTRTFENVGFVGGIEGVQRVLNPDGTQKRAVGYQIGITDTVFNVDSGFHTYAAGGTIDVALRISASLTDGGKFNDYWNISNGNRVISRLNNAGEILLRNPNGSGLSQSIRVSSIGAWDILDDTRTLINFSLDTTGAGYFRASVAAPFIQAQLALRLTPQSAPPPLAQGRMYLSAATGKIMICEDGGQYRTVTTT